ncbi:MAG: UDP-N-acetylmuramoyl-L-alanine--D-glutamate ligase [Mycobacteriales bacterium]
MTARSPVPAPDWEHLVGCVAGLGISGVAAAETLLRRGARVTVVDARTGERETVRAALLEALGARVLLGAAAATKLPAGTGLVVTSPGWRPDAPLLVAAAAAGVPVWGEVELAWRLRSRPAAPWLAVTGTNGKTTTVRMLAAMLASAGHRTVAAGNVGMPLLEAVQARPAYDVLAVELSSFQLHWSASLECSAAAVLNVAPDHLDWHGSFEAYAVTKAKIYRGVGTAVFNAGDPVSRQLAAGAPRRVGVTLGPPPVGYLGVTEGVLLDNAFGPTVELAAAAEVRPAGPHNVANALAAAALARAYGVPPAAVRGGLVAYAPDPHRNAAVGTVGGVAYVDDSKATNPHAAAASLSAYPSVVWVAGGLAKGASFDDLVAGVAGRLRAAVLLGADRGEIAAALRRHAPDLPVVEVAATDTGAMDTAVCAAAELANRGDTVLLAPAAASMDMFTDYRERGSAFAAAVGRLAGADR